MVREWFEGGIDLAHVRLDASHRVLGRAGDAEHNCENLRGGIDLDPKLLCSSRAGDGRGGGDNESGGEAHASTCLVAE